MRLEGKRAIIVGAGQSPGATVGIGRATAISFAREGAHVLLVDRDPDSMEETRARVAAEGPEPGTLVADIRDEQACASIAAAARERLGGADVLFHGVGIHGPGAPVDVDTDLWDTVIDVNLKGMWLVAKHVLPIMIEQRQGSVIMVSSIGALAGGASSVYGISKAGVNRLTTSIAATYAPYDIRANAILPGLVETPMAIEGSPSVGQADREAYVQQRARRTPMAYKGSAWDVANAAVWFASDDSRFVSGNFLLVDGALMAAR